MALLAWGSVSARPLRAQQPARDNPTRAQAPQQAASGIRGRVVDIASGRPLPKARMTLLSTAGDAPAPVFTDANGDFSFSQLPPGHYSLRAEKTGYARLPFGSRSELDPAVELDLEPGAQNAPLLVRLIKGAAIAGRISDEYGDPVVGGDVYLSVLKAVGDGVRAIRVARPAALTDDRGQYRIGDLGPGRYVVTLAAANLGSMAPGTPREWERLAPWGKTFYPGARSLGEATAITLAPGEDRGAVDFSVRSHERAQVRLSTNGMPAYAPPSGPGGPNRQQLQMWFFSEDDDAAGNGRPIGMTGFGGDLPGIVMPNFPVNEPGDWTAFARSGDKAAITNFHLSGGDDFTVNMNFLPTSAVSGRVVFDGASAHPDPSTVSISVRGAGPDERVPARLLSAPVKARTDGTFALSGLVGTIDIETSTPPPGWILSAALYQGHNLLDEPLALEPGKDASGVQLVFSDRVGAVAGRAVLPDGSPAAGCTVAIFPDDATLRFTDRRMRLTRADDRGAFSIRDLPAGTYRAAAAVDIDASAWLTRSAIDQLRGISSPVVVAGRGAAPATLACVVGR